MTIPRLDIAARETGPWAHQAIILLGDEVAWSCHHEHAEAAQATTCARFARITVCPAGRTALEEVYHSRTLSPRWRALWSWWSCPS